MRRIFTLAFLLVLATSSFSQSPLANTLWIDTPATPIYYYQNVTPYIDTSRHVLIIFNSDITGIYSQSTVSLIDNSGGAMNWQTSFTIPGYWSNYGSACYIKGRYCYATGFTLDSLSRQSSMYLYKLNLSDGSTVWDTVFSASSFPGYEVPAGIFVDDTSNVYIAATCQFDTVDYRMSAIKFDSTGHMRFLSTYDSIGLYSGAVGLALFGNKVVLTGFSGNSYSSWDFLTVGFNTGSGSVQSVSRSGNAGGNFSTPVGIMTEADRFIITGTAATSTGHTIIKTISYDSLFTPQYTILWGDSTVNSAAASITEDGSGNPAITGYTTGPSGAKQTVLLDYNGGTGALQLSKAISAPNQSNDAQGVSVGADAYSLYIASKVSNGTTHSMVTTAYDYSGNQQWQKTYNRTSTTDDAPLAVIALGGQVITSGISTGTDTLYTAIDYYLWTPTPCGDTVCPTITYAFGNNHVTTSGTDTFIEFDLLAKSAPGLSFKSGSVILTYSDSVFGDSLVYYNDITFTRGTITADTNYLFYLADTLFQSDAVKTNDREVWLSVAAAGSGGLYMLPDSLTQLCHVKMKRQHRGTDGIAFDQFFMEGGSDYLSGDYEEYTNVLVGSPLDEADSVQFSITNVTLDTITGNSYIDFDVFGAATIAGAALANYQVVVNFNPLAFDSAYVTNSMLYGLGDDGSACYCGGGGYYGGDSLYTFTSSFAPGSVTINMALDSFYELYNYDIEQFNYIAGPTPLAHVRLHIANCHYQPNITLDQSCSASWDDTTNIYGYDSYMPVSFSPGYNDTMCTPLPKIMGWSPECTNAGDFQVVTIWGAYFGTGSGTVYFNNANDSGTFVHTLPQDIREWTSDTIQLLIPSAVTADPTVGTAGTGPFYVQTGRGLNDSVNAPYIAISHADYNRRSADGHARFVYLQDSPYVFHLSSTLFYTAGVAQSVKYVFADLQCQTGINFQLDTLAPSTVDTPANDGINLISYQPDSARVFLQVGPDALAVTTCSSRRAFTGLALYNDSASYVRDIDISFNSSPLTGGIPSGWNWWLYITNLSSTPWIYDAVSVLTHETGHAGMLDHALPFKSNSRNIMYTSIPSGIEERGYDSDSNSILGMKYGLSLGGTLGAADGHPALPAVFPINCPTVVPTTCVNDGVNSISQITSSTGFTASLYPNPYQSTTIVHVDVSQYGDYSIVLYDIVGHLIMEKAVSTGESFDIPLTGFDFSTGMYLIRVSDSHSNVVLKLVKL